MRTYASSRVTRKRFYRKSELQAPVVQKLDSAIHRINHYPADSVIDFRNIDLARAKSEAPVNKFII